MQKSRLNGTNYLVGATTDNSGGVSSLVDQSKYFLPLENTKPPRTLVDVTQLFFPESVIVAIACGKSEQSRNRSLLILECVEQEHYAIRRTTAGPSVSQ
jgi:hypothetical protein